MAERLSASRLIERHRVTELLQRTLAAGHVLLTAPAGYGKSVALRQLAARRPNSHLVPLTPADADLAVVESKVRPLLEPGNTILIDDVHVLEGASEACVWLQQHLDTPHPRWLLAGRRLPFAADLLTITGQATLITQDELAFSDPEARLLLARQDEQLDVWQKRLQGWALGLSLLSRLPANDDSLEIAQEHLFRYLAETVFDRLPKDLQRFLRATAIPLRFNGDLARSIWPDPEQADQLLAEVERRDIYLQPAAAPGWVRYHELIRDLLLRDAGDDRGRIGRLIVAWHRANGDLLSAMEQALDSGLTSLGAELLADMPLSHFHTHTSYLTYRRWVRALDDNALAAHPMLLVRLANILGMMGGYDEEARSVGLRGVQLAETQGNQHTRLLAEVNLALLDKLAGRLDEARTRILAVLAADAGSGYPRLFALRIAGLIAGEMGDGPRAAAFAEEAMALAPSLGAVNEQMMARANRMHHFLLPRGRFNEAAVEIAAVLNHFGDAPGWRSQYLVNLCELQAQQGDWSQLAETLAELETLAQQVETPTAYLRLWRQHFRTVLAVATGTPAEVDAALASYQALAEDSPLHRSAGDWLAVWHLRRLGAYAAAIERADALLADRGCAPFYRPHVALESDIAQGLAFLAGARDRFSLHPETRLIRHRRLTPLLVRLRALLAVVCHRAGHSRWRRHWLAARRGVHRPGYLGLLTRLDPQLAAPFWLIGVTEGLHMTEAVSALGELDDGVAQLLSSLMDESPQVRRRCAEALAQIGKEQAIPGLVIAQNEEQDPTIRAQMSRALDRHFRQPPPPLRIQLLGGFALQRGDRPVPDSAWSRPIVQRLFQYFAVHAGQPIPKDRLLEDLWPDLVPKRGWRNFRTIYSLLRKVLEPYMPPRTPNRYFAVSGETYTFDPLGVADIDLVRFCTATRSSLFRAQHEHPAALSESFRNVLEAYGVLLPGLPYVEWLIAPRQEAEELYLAGCHHAARTLLAQGRLAQAVAWADRVVQRAVWHEEAHQVLMRAHARRGQRAAALHVFHQVTERLRDELGVEPSPLTSWLAERLRDGQDI